MNINVILHTRYNINCSKIIRQLIKGNTFLKYDNNYLIPFHCSKIHHKKCIIRGNFMYSIWNTLQRTLLNNNTQFNYTYVTGSNYTVELENTSFKRYHIVNNNRMYSNAVMVNDAHLKENSILLFPIHSMIATPLIKHRLINLTEVDNNIILT